MDARLSRANKHTPQPRYHSPSPAFAHLSGSKRSVAATARWSDGATVELARHAPSLTASATVNCPRAIT